MNTLQRYDYQPKAVPESELADFCSDIREFLLTHISQTGGHLASNLGAVELTVALHRVLDTATDRLVFDVGHQSYVHKLLTSRVDGFDHFRCMGGMSGFLKPSESVHDAFISGHASNSVSVALGMARARSLSGDEYRVAALLGDGALTGGLAYEGLSDAGASQEPLVILLNDNGMSINLSVGAIARHLQGIRLQPNYFSAKKNLQKLMKKFPGGDFLDSQLNLWKDAVRSTVVPGSFFEQMGFVYLGPVDGHDISQLEFLIRKAIEMKKPVLIHAHTIKGKGYLPAEDSPGQFHGVGKFDVKTGTLENAQTSFSTQFGAVMIELAKDNKKICAISAAMTDGTGLSPFFEKYPHRAFDVGIAEGHAVSMAAGMAKQGLHPVVAVYSTFLQRSYDQILHDVGLLHLPVIFAVDRAGLVGEDGETHHGLFDVAYLSTVPGMTIYSPSNFKQQRELFARAIDMDGPVAIRYPRGQECQFNTLDAVDTLVRQGRDATIVTYGRILDEAIKCAEILEQIGISIGVISLICLKPLDVNFVLSNQVGPLFFLEEGTGILGQYFEGTGIDTNDSYVGQGSVPQLLEYCHLDASSIAKTIQDNLHSRGD
jgi:1-deoxy-D-xylulose-5-phosphate synthase